jgi:hypothetical protein
LPSYVEHGDKVELERNKADAEFAPVKTLSGPEFGPVKTALYRKLKTELQPNRHWARKHGADAHRIGNLHAVSILKYDCTVNARGFEAINSESQCNICIQGRPVLD